MLTTISAQRLLRETEIFSFDFYHGNASANLILIHVSSTCSNQTSSECTCVLDSYKTVELMRLGFSPSEAASLVFDEMQQFYPDVGGAVVAVSKNGTHGYNQFFTSHKNSNYK